MTLRLLEDRLNLVPGRTSVAIQGFGNVGSHAAKYLHEAGVRVVGVTDLYGGVYCRDGLDIEALLGHAERKVTVRDFPGASPLSNAEALTLDVDVLIPATIRDLLGSGMDAASERNRSQKCTLAEAAVAVAVERVYDAMRRRRMI